MTKVEKKPRTMIGEVVSNRMDKTIVVSVTRKVPHPKYGKYITRHTKLFVHNPTETVKIGDTALVQTSRPLSKKKRWSLVEILQKEAPSS